MTYRASCNDADYPGTVKARKEHFDSINLTKDRDYIASTGIQDGTGDRFADVAMDAYAVTGDGKRIPNVLSKASPRFSILPISEQRISPASLSI